MKDLDDRELDPPGPPQAVKGPRVSPMRSVTAAAALLLAVSAVALLAGPISEVERQRLVAHLEMTGSWLEDEVSGLSPAQLDFRRAPGAWTILEAFDHLVVVGPIYWKDLQNARPPADGRASWMSDADVLWYGIDRTRRETALTTEQPTRAVRELRAGLDKDPEAARAVAAVHPDHDRRLAQPPRGAAGMRRVSVGAPDFNARTAAHSSDPRDQGRPEVPEEVTRTENRTLRFDGGAAVRETCFIGITGASVTSAPPCTDPAK